MSFPTLGAVSNSTAIPGKTISPPRLPECAEAEVEAIRQYGEDVLKAGGALPDSMRQTLLNRMADNLMGAPFSYGMNRFNAWVFTARGTQFVAWLSLRIKEGGITLAQTAELLIAHPEATLAVWQAWGFTFTKKAEGEPANPPTGTVSTPA